MAETEDKKQEVLLARDSKTGEVGAVVGQKEDGKPKLKDVRKTTANELIKFNKHENPLEAFLSNFIRQARNPTEFVFFKLNLEHYEQMAEPMAEMLNDYETNKEMLDKYRVNESQVNEKETTKMENKNRPIDPDLVDWAAIEKQWGITREQLEASGDLKQMIYNHKSPNLFKLTPTLDGERIEAEAKLSFRHNPDGSISLTPHFVRNQPDFQREYYGYSFTKEDEANMRATGNLGKAVELMNPSTQEKEKCLISLDRKTNEIEHMPVSKIYIKPKVANIELTMQEIGILKNGGVLRERAVELPNGSKFIADLQYNVEKRDVAFNSEPYRKQNIENAQPMTEERRQRYEQWTDDNGNPKRLTQWCKIPLDEQKQADYMAGKQVMVGETKDRKGNDCIIYFQFDKAAGKPVTTYKYPDRNKVVGIANESKTQFAVNNEGKTNEATKNMDEPLKKGQTTPKDDNQMKEQKKSKGQKL